MPAQDNTINEPWVSVDDVAKHLGIRRETIYRWIDSKDLPVHRVGRLWKCKLSEIDAWVKSGGAAVVNENKEDRHG